MPKHHRPSPAPSSCPPKTPLSSRKRLEAPLVRRLTEIFGLLSSGTRVRILHALAREGEIHVQAIADGLRMRVAAVSNQLRLMAMLGILQARSDGLRVLYSIADPCVPSILETGACLAEDSRRRRKRL